MNSPQRCRRYKDIYVESGALITVRVERHCTRNGIRNFQVIKFSSNLRQTLMNRIIAHEESPQLAHRLCTTPTGDGFIWFKIFPLQRHLRLIIVCHQLPP